MHWAVYRFDDDGYIARSTIMPWQRAEAEHLANDYNHVAITELRGSCKYLAVPLPQYGED